MPLVIVIFAIVYLKRLRTLQGSKSNIEPNWLTQCKDNGGSYPNWFSQFVYTYCRFLGSMYLQYKCKIKKVWFTKCFFCILKVEVMLLHHIQTCIVDLKLLRNQYRYLLKVCSFFSWVCLLKLGSRQNFYKFSYRLQIFE